MKWDEIWNRYGRVACAVVLWLMAAAYMAKGFRQMMWAPDGALDLKQRWVEQRYVMEGENPADVVERLKAIQRGEARLDPLGRDALLVEVGMVTPAVYPPWAYGLAYPFLWPSEWKMARWYYGGLNGLVVLFLMAWALTVAGRGAGLTAAVIGGGLLAMSSLCTTLGLGQYGVLVLACLAAAWWLDREDESLMAGVFLGIGFLKFTLAAPFALVFLVKGRWASLFSAAVVVAAATGLIWWRLDTPPWVMWEQMMAGAQGYAEGGYGLVDALVAFGVPLDQALRGAAIGVLALALVVMAIWHRAGLLVHFAVAGVAARFWTYHNHYDNLIVGFLLAATGAVAVRDGSRRMGWCFLVLGLSLWPPARFTEIGVYRVFQCVVWAGGLGMLLVHEWRNPNAGDRTAIVIGDRGEAVAPGPDAA